MSYIPLLMTSTPLTQSTPLTPSPISDKYSPKLGPKPDPITECDEIITVVKGLYDKYLDDDYARAALVYHIKNTLPSLLQQKCDARIQREERRKTLEETSEEFIREFINSSSYYYNPNIDLFFVYHNNTYKIINEDEIEHEIRTTITDQQNSELSTWKYKIKNQIIKKIKERDLLTSIPESETIQRVLNALTPFVFKNKDSAKYFLTIIGDILLKKNTNTYFISTKAKHFISELGEESYALFGTSNMMNHFKFKFYEHKYDECRLIDTVENVISFPFYTHNEGLKLAGHNGMGMSMGMGMGMGMGHSLSSSSLSSLAGGGMSMSISNSGISTPKTPTTPGHGHGHSHMHSTNVIQKQSMLDLFCVAAHYSSRFNSADLFIEKICKDHAVKEHAFYLKNITDDDILSRFISSTTDPCKGVHITWKNMLYLWKIFIEEEKIPNVFFTNVLKKHLIKRLEYSCEHVVTVMVTNTNTNIVTENDGGYMGGLETVVAGDSGEIGEIQDNREMFLNITSKHLPLVGKFMSFWNENIKCNHTEIELEIDELSTLFLNHGNVYHGNQKNIQTITDQTILGFIRHFLPDICIEEDKYLMNIGCKLWDKKHEILNGLEEFKKANLRGNSIMNASLGKSRNKNKDAKDAKDAKDLNTIIVKKEKEKDNHTDLSVSSTSSSFPVHTIYDFYCKWGYKHNKMVVSKRYFEKFFIENYGDNLTEKNGTLWWSY